MTQILTTGVGACCNEYSPCIMCLLLCPITAMLAVGLCLFNSGLVQKAQWQPSSTGLVIPVLTHWYEGQLFVVGSTGICTMGTLLVIPAPM